MAACIMFIGAVVWMKGLVSADAGPVAAAFLAEGRKGLFFAGLAGVLVSMFGWWSDVIKESKAGDHTPVVSIGLRYGMILFIASEVMFFAAFFWMFNYTKTGRAMRAVGMNPKAAQLVGVDTAEAVVVSVTEWPSRAARDKGNAAATQDPRVIATLDEDPVFDGKRLLGDSFDTRPYPPGE